MDSYMFERCFIAVVCEEGVKKYGSVMAYAKKIWPQKDEKSAAQTLYNIQTKSNKTGRPQRLKLEEAVTMVNLLDKSDGFAAFCWGIERRLNDGWNEDTADSFPGSYDYQASKKKDLCPETNINSDHDKNNQPSAAAT